MFTTLNTKGAINVFKILRRERLEPSPLYNTRCTSSDLRFEYSLMFNVCRVKTLFSNVKRAGDATKIMQL